MENIRWRLSHSSCPGLRRRRCELKVDSTSVSKTGLLNGFIHVQVALYLTLWGKLTWGELTRTENIFSDFLVFL